MNQAKVCADALCGTQPIGNRMCPCLASVREQNRDGTRTSQNPITHLWRTDDDNRTKPGIAAEGFQAPAQNWFPA
jgi:hypothetical protein